MIPPDHVASAFEACGLSWAEIKHSRRGGRHAVLLGHKTIRVHVHETPWPHWRVIRIGFYYSTTAEGVCSRNAAVMVKQAHDTYEVCLEAANHWILHNVYGPIVEDSARRLGHQINYNPSDP